MFKNQSILNSFLNAFHGLKEVVKNERNMRIVVSFIPPVVVYGIYAEIGKTEFSVVLLCIFIVIIAEIINTAVENTIDGVIKEYNDKAKTAKDTAAAATLTASVAAALCGGTVLYKSEKILQVVLLFKKPIFIVCTIGYIVAAYIFAFKGGKNG